MSPTSFGKRDRDRAKKMKAAQKRERRQSDGSAAAAPTGTADAPSSASAASTSEILERIGELHRQHDAGEIADDEFEATKASLLAELVIE